MQIQDDRTPEQRETHQHLVIGTDRGMSGWGGAEGGVSYAAWACRPEDSTACLDWVEGRGDMSRVRFTVDLPHARYRPSAKGHLHIYVYERPEVCGHCGA